MKIICFDGKSQIFSLHKYISFSNNRINTILSFFELMRVQQNYITDQVACMAYKTFCFRFFLLLLSFKLMFCQSFSIFLIYDVFCENKLWKDVCYTHAIYIFNPISTFSHYFSAFCNEFLQELQRS